MFGVGEVPDGLERDSPLRTQASPYRASGKLLSREPSASPHFPSGHRHLDVRALSASHSRVPSRRLQCLALLASLAWPARRGREGLRKFPEIRGSVSAFVTGTRDRIWH